MKTVHAYNKLWKCKLEIENFYPFDSDSIPCLLTLKSIYLHESMKSSFFIHNMGQVECRIRGYSFNKFLSTKSLNILYKDKWHVTLSANMI